MLHVEDIIGNEQEAGIYTWSLADDRLYGDTAVASLFGLDPALTIKGLPLTDYIQRVYAGDRFLLSTQITKAVRDGLPYNAEYRVLNSEDKFVLVMAVGRCFRNGRGNPTLYSGIIYPLDQLQAMNHR